MKQMKTLTYDDFIEDSSWCKSSAFQRMFVSIKGKEYPITDWIPESDPVVDPNDPDLREEDNQRIVFEVNI